MTRRVPIVPTLVVAAAVVVMIAVLGFGELLGFVGVVLAVPLAGVLKVVLRVLFARYSATGWYRAAAGDRPTPEQEQKEAPGAFSA